MITVMLNVVTHISAKIPSIFAVNINVFLMMRVVTSFVGVVVDFCENSL